MLSRKHTEPDSKSVFEDYWMYQGIRIPFSVKRVPSLDGKHTVNWVNHNGEITVRVYPCLAPDCFDEPERTQQEYREEYAVFKDDYWVWA